MYNIIERKIALGRIEEYLTSRGYSVEYDSNTYYLDTDSNTIHAPKQYKYTTKSLCALLPDSELLTIYRRSKVDQALVIEQEYRAWDKGLSIARELRIASREFVQIYKFEWVKHWCSYINMGASPLFDTLAEPYRVRSRVHT